MSRLNEKNFILDDADRLMSIDETAYRLRSSPDFVRDLIEAEMLKAYTFKRNIKRIRKTVFNEFLNAHDGENLPEVLAAKLLSMRGN